MLSLGADADHEGDYVRYHKAVQLGERANTEALNQEVHDMNYL
jgi:hypothetical protein